MGLYIDPCAFGGGVVHYHHRNQFTGDMGEGMTTKKNAAIARGGV